MRGAELLRLRTTCGERDFCCRVYIHCTCDGTSIELLVAEKIGTNRLRPANRLDAVQVFDQARLLGWFGQIPAYEIKLVRSRKKLKKRLRCCRRLAKRAKEWRRLQPLELPSKMQVCRKEVA